MPNPRLSFVLRPTQSLNRSMLIRFQKLIDVPGSESRHSKYGGRSSGVSSPVQRLKDATAAHLDAVGAIAGWSDKRCERATIGFDWLNDVWICSQPIPPMVRL
jgi:hypothetical protein